MRLEFAGSVDVAVGAGRGSATGTTKATASAIAVASRGSKRRTMHMTKEKRAGKVNYWEDKHKQILAAWPPAVVQNWFGREVFNLDGLNAVSDEAQYCSSEIVHHRLMYFLENGEWLPT